MHLAPNFNRPVLHRLDRSTHMPTNVVNKHVVDLVFEKECPQLARLLEVCVRDLGGVGLHLPAPLVEGYVGVLELLLHGTEGAAHVVWVAAVVAIKAHGAVALEWGVDGRARFVAGELLVIWSDAVPGGVRVGEHARLEHDIGAWSDTRDHVRGAERRLLDVLEVVVRVAVQCKLTNGLEWVVRVRPGHGIVEDIIGYGLCVCRIHDLNVQCPGGEGARGDRIEHVADVIVRVFASKTCGVFFGECIMPQRR